VELENQRQRYEERGIRVAALSYDPVATVNAFAERARIGYPLLADPDSRWIRDANVFNDTLTPDNPAYGLAYPGWILTDGDGVVTQKVFHEAYADRTTSAALLVRSFGEDGAEVGEASTDHVKVRWSASNAAVRFGQMITLTVTVTPGPGLHVYGPGTEGYFVVSWEPDGEDHAVEWLETSFPAPRTLQLSAIDGAAPVYDETFRLIRDVHLPNDKALRERLADAEELVLRATLTYQACDDTVCFLPVIVPLEWKLRLQPHDRERVPEELRR